MNTDTIKLENKNSTLMVAHRGVSGLERENTAAAFIAAGNRSYFGVETDIYHTSDGEYICSHDNSTGRICSVDIPIEQSTFAELRSLTLTDIGGATDRRDLMLCTPYEYKKICKHYNKHCVPELKSGFTKDEMKEILGIFSDYLDHTTFISFNFHNLEIVKAIRPSQDVQFLTCKWEESLPAMLAERSMNLDILHSELTAERVEACHAAGVKVNCWTVDSAERAAEIVSFGTDFITTNILE